MDFIAQRNIPYVIACKLYANLQASIYGITQWNAIGEGLWVSEINYQQGGWGKARRIAVIKQSEEIDWIVQLKNLSLKTSRGISYRCH
ncbi:MAG: hypothetical protein ING88_11210 [Cytophagales bacterium]|nr:hypothetical protein [Cytophagales bacterium]